MDFSTVLARFPNVELSYDKTLDKKVHADSFALLPSGEQALLWITYIGKQRIALILKLNKFNNIVSVTPKLMAFHDNLSLGDGTLFQGIIFNYKSILHFACNDIVLHSGRYVYNKSMIDKMELVCNILSSEIDARIVTNDSMSIGLPITTTNFNDAIDIARSCPYKVSNIRYLSMKSSKAIGIKKYTSKTTTTAVLNVRANIQPDLYYLLTSDGKIHKHPAAVQDYETSVMLNNQFRKIKENKNLDFLEESDDDHEFEDVRIDKYVDLSKSALYVCEFLPKFGKWQPIKLSNRSQRVTSSRELFEIERKNRH